MESLFRSYAGLLLVGTYMIRLKLLALGRGPTALLIRFTRPCLAADAGVAPVGWRKFDRVYWIPVNGWVLASSMCIVRDIAIGLLVVIRSTRLLLD